MGLSERGIPEENLPQCWRDDIRMNALFAPFRLKTANPESWDMKMKFWSDMLRQWCKHRRDPIVSAADAKVAFQRKNRTAACIEIVVEEMYESGDLAPLSKYQQILHNGPEGWVRWTARLAFKPAAFAFTAVSSLLPGRQSLDNDGLPKACIDSSQRFVLESSVKELATELLNTDTSDTERIGTVDELMKNFNYNGSREVFEVLLGWLVSHGHAVKTEDIIKLGLLDKRVTPITETDKALVKLISAERQLENDANRLDREVASIEAEAKAALQVGNKLLAKNHLRRKHKVVRRLDQCTKSLDNVQQLLQQMKDANVNVAIAGTYKTASEAMKRDMKENNVEVDTVHETMDDLKEVMESYSEIEKILSTTVEDLDAAELEDELKELLSKPNHPSSGTPGKEKGAGIPQKSARKESEKDFVFDGEERMLAELNKLDIEETTPKKNVEKKKEKVTVVAEDWEKKETPIDLKTTKPSKPWYPPTDDCLRSKMWKNNNNEMPQEVRTDERLHPGQPVNVDFSRPPHMFSSDFAVRDHKMAYGVWLYNRDDNSNIDDLAQSTEYFSSESPGKNATGSFLMAPGGERRKSENKTLTEQLKTEESSLEQLERRLKNLRGFNL